jgi:hypothetical protein
MAVSLSPLGGVAGQFFDNNGVPLSGGLLYTYAAGTTTAQPTYFNASGVILNANPIVLDAGGRVPNEIWLNSGLYYKFVLKTSAGVLIGSWDNITGINSNFINYNAQEQIQTATAGQTVFTLTGGLSYTPNTNTLQVFVDGVNQYDGSSYSYTETNSTTVTFTQGLHVGALVKFTTAVALSAGVVSSNLVTYLPAGIDAVETTVQTKLRQTVSVKDFGAVGDGIKNDASAIQAAINYVSSIGGGTVNLPSAKYYIGTASPAISIPSFVRLLGDGNSTGGLALTGGTELLYGGSGTAVYAQGMSISCNDFLINCTTPSGSSMIGLLHDGGWFGDYARLSIFGIPAANGHVVKVTSGPALYGCFFTCFDQVTGQAGSWLVAGRSPGDGITTFTLKDCYIENISFAYAQGVMLNGSVTSNTGTCIYFSTYCFFTLIGVDIEGAAPIGIGVNDSTSTIKEFGTIWNGWSGAQRVVNNGSDMSTVSYGAFSSQQTLATNTPTLYGQVGGQAYSTAATDRIISDYVLPTNLIGGSVTGSRYWMRFNNGTNIIDHQWREHAYITKTITTTTTSAYTIWTIPVTPSEGLRLSVFAHGSQTGDTAFANSRNCNVSNNAGTLTIASDTQLTAGDSGAISFVASGSNILVQWTPVTTNTSNPNFNLEIRGLWTSYS